VLVGFWISARLRSPTFTSGKDLHFQIITVLHGFLPQLEARHEFS
jgi:hypothetical protein